MLFISFAIILVERGTVVWSYQCVALTLTIFIGHMYSIFIWQKFNLCYLKCKFGGIVNIMRFFSYGQIQRCSEVCVIILFLRSFAFLIITRDIPVQVCDWKLFFFLLASLFLNINFAVEFISIEHVVEIYHRDFRFKIVVQTKYKNSCQWHLWNGKLLFCCAITPSLSVVLSSDMCS